MDSAENTKTQDQKPSCMSQFPLGSNINGCIDQSLYICIYRARKHGTPVWGRSTRGCVMARPLALSLPQYNYYLFIPHRHFILYPSLPFGSVAWPFLVYLEGLAANCGVAPINPNDASIRAFKFKASASPMARVSGSFPCWAAPLQQPPRASSARRVEMAALSKNECVHMCV